MVNIHVGQYVFMYLNMNNNHNFYLQIIYNEVLAGAGGLEGLGQ